MKKILFRKLLFDYLTFFFVALMSTGVIIWVFQAVNFLDIMIEDGRDYLIYLKYSLLNFPKVLSKLFPFILFFSLFYVTIRYEYKNEMIIYWNFGIHKIEIINFILKFSIFLLLVQIIFSAIIVPNSQDLARSYLRNSNINFVSNFIKPKRFNDTIKGLTIYSEKKDADGNLYNLYLKKGFKQNDFQITYAEKGVFKEINKTPTLILYSGETITVSNDEITKFSFSKSDFFLENLKTNTTTYKKTQELSTIDILKCINNIYELKIKLLSKKNKNIENCTQKNFKNILKEFYKRLVIPLYIPILTLVPLILIISSKENSNYKRLRIITFLIGLFIVISSETTIRFISQSVTSNLLISIIPFLLMFIIYVTFLKKLNNLEKN